MLVGGLRPAVARDGGCDHLEALCGQQGDDLIELPDGAGPAVDDQQGPGRGCWNTQPNTVLIYSCVIITVHLP